MYKNATKCNETIGKWCKTKHGASKMIDTFETYQSPLALWQHRIQSSIPHLVRLPHQAWLWEDESHKAAFEERRVIVKEKKTMEELIANKNNTMMMDLSAMYALTRESWSIDRMEILQRERQSLGGGDHSPKSGDGDG
jgi:hypothetical protein